MSWRRTRTRYKRSAIGTALLERFITCKARREFVDREASDGQGTAYTRFRELRMALASCPQKLAPQNLKEKKNMGRIIRAPNNAIHTYQRTGRKSEVWACNVSDAGAQATDHIGYR